MNSKRLLELTLAGVMFWASCCNLCGLTRCVRTLSVASTSLEEAFPFDKRQKHQLNWPFNSSDANVKIYVVHVGKAGGTSLSKRFLLKEAKNLLPCRKKASNGAGNDAHCLPNVSRDDPKHSVIRSRIYGLLHIQNVFYTEDDRKWLRKNTNLLMFTVRDPVDRLLSAFRYQHSKSFGNDKARKRRRRRRRRNHSKLHTVLYLDCFPEFEDVGLALTRQYASNYSQKCRKIAKTVVQGNKLRNDGGFNHFRYNYRYYTKKTWPEKALRRIPVAVIRTESQWHDVARLESLLGGDPEPFQNYTFKYTHRSEESALRSELSLEASIGVCCAIRDEIQIYHNIIAASVNLYPNEKEETLRNTMARCGVHGAQDMASKDILGFQWTIWTHPTCDEEIENSSLFARQSGK